MIFPFFLQFSSSVLARVLPPAGQIFEKWRPLENIERFSKLLVRRLKDVDITLLRPSGDKIYLGGGGKPVVLQGTPSEIGLFLFGRREQSEVKLTGDPEAVDEIKTGKLG